MPSQGRLVIAADSADVQTLPDSFAQEPRQDLSEMTIISVQTDGFLVEVQDHAGFNDTVVVGKTGAIAFSELCQLHRALGLSEQVKSFGHHAIQAQQVSLVHVALSLGKCKHQVWGLLHG